MARGINQGPRSRVDPAGKLPTRTPRSTVSIWHRGDVPGIGRGMCRSPMRRRGRRGRRR